MKWTERFELGYATHGGAYYSGSDRSRCNWFERPQWLWPLIRRDHLEHILRKHYPDRDEMWLAEFLFTDLPVFEHRSGYRFAYYDLRIVARLAPPGKQRTCWRCATCGKKMFRRWESGRECCSGECAAVYQEKCWKEWQRSERKRQKEWQRIKQCRLLLKQARQLLRENREAFRSQSEASKPATTLPPSCPP